MPLISKKVYVRIFSELIIRTQSAMENLVRNGAMMWEQGSRACPSFNECGRNHSYGLAMTTADLPKPDFAYKMRLIGHSDQGGRPDGVQLMVHRGFAYVGHMFSKGFSVIDVSDPRKPKAVNYIAAPENTWNIHLQTHDDLLLVIHAKDMFAAAEFRTRRPITKARSAAKLAAKAASRVPATGRPVSRSMTFQSPASTAPDRLHARSTAADAHRIWYVGGRWAYVSAPARRLHRLHTSHHRHAGSHEASQKSAATGCRE